MEYKSEQNMNNLKFLLPILLIGSSSFTQDIGYHFGHQMFGVFNARQPIHGISIGLDIPRTGFVTPYGQFSIFAPHKRIETNVGSGVPKNPADPFLFNVDAKARTNTYSFEFGTIYYIGGAYDYGFSAMVHNSLRLLLMPTKRELIDFDFAKYEFQPSSVSTGLSGSNGFALYTSLGVGAKYSFDWGSIYAIGGIELALHGERLPSYFFDEFGIASRFAFSTRLGIRKELDFSSKGNKKQKRENEKRERQKW
jgi:hypothetical protein